MSEAGWMCERDQMSRAELTFKAVQRFGALRKQAATF